MLKLLRFLKGYLVISFKGEQIEKLLNIFAKNGLNTWDMIYSKGTITGCISISSFKKLKDLKRGIKSRVKIKSKHGLPFIINNYKKRSGIIVGAVVFFLIIKLLSLYIWDIDVVGNEKTTKAEILNSCSDIGIKEGMKAKDIDTKNDVLKLMLNNKNLAWASLNIEGSKLTVNITEISEFTYNKNRPSNIKASRDGIITKVTANSGDIVVKPGDTVRQGDILISGIKERLTSIVFVKSSGNVYAKTIREFEAYKPFSEKVTALSSKTKSKSVFIFFNLRFPLYIGKIGNISILDIKEYNLSLSGQKLPCGIIKATYKDVYEKQVKNSEEAILKALNKDIENQIENAKIIVLNSLNEDIIRDDKGILLKKVVECEELISFEEEIIIDSEN